MKQVLYLLLHIALPVLLAAQKTDSIKIKKSDSAVIKRADSASLKNVDSIAIKKDSLNNLQPVYNGILQNILNLLR